MSHKYPKPPPLTREATTEARSKSGFEVEFRDGFYYIIAVPENSKDINVGDRVLEINGVQAFNFQSTRSANDLFDTVCLLYIPKEEIEKKASGNKSGDDDDSSTSSGEIIQKRKGRRTTLEEEARKAGADRQSSRTIGELMKKQEKEEKDFRRAEAEIRRMGRMDRERQKNQTSPSPPPPPPKSAVKVDRNIGSFSPAAVPKGKGGWAKVSANHRSNG